MRVYLKRMKVIVWFAMRFWVNQTSLVCPANILFAKVVGETIWCRRLKVGLQALKLGACRLDATSKLVTLSSRIYWCWKTQRCWIRTGNGSVNHTQMIINALSGAQSPDASFVTKKIFIQQQLKLCALVEVHSVSNAGMNLISRRTAELLRDGKRRTLRRVQIYNGLLQTRRHARDVKDQSRKIKGAITWNANPVDMISVGFV